MKKRLIALGLSILLLSGCQMLALLDQVREEGASSSARDGEKPESSSLPERTSPALSLPSRSSQPEQASTSAVDSILENAGPNDLMAVLQVPEAAAYRALGEPKAQIDEARFGDGVDHETILILPLQEGVKITVESIWLDYSLGFLYPVEVLGEFSGKPGEHLALHVFLAEAIPHARVVAQLGDQYAVWYCHYDGRGAEDIEYIGVQMPDPIQQESSGINLLSVAAASTAAIFAEGEAHLTPEELREWPSAYWQAVACALTIYMQDSEGDFDANSGEYMQASKWLVDAMRLALFPGTEGESLDPQAGGVYRGGEDYLIFPCYYGDFMYWECISSASDVDGTTGAVVVEITSPDLLLDSVRYQVTWAANDPLDLYSPFQYHMTGISLLPG